MAGTLSECYNSDVTAVSKVKSGRSTSLFCPVNTYGADPGQEHVAELLYQCVYSRHNASVRVYLDKTEQFGYSIPTQAVPLYDSDSIHGNSMEPVNYNPVVSGSSPNSGPIEGGTIITYTGLNLHSIRYCLFVLASGSDNRYTPGGNSKYKYAVNATAVGDNSFQCITPDVSAANSLVAHVSFSINEIAWLHFYDSGASAFQYYPTPMLYGSSLIDTMYSTVSIYGSGLNVKYDGECMVFLLSIVMTMTRDDHNDDDDDYTNHILCFLLLSIHIFLTFPSPFFRYVPINFQQWVDFATVSNYRL
jgi:hypothetical protein